VMALLVFSVALIWYSPFGMGMFTLCHWILEVCNLFFYIYWSSQLRVALIEF
jgi:hypothetical protein